MPLRRILEQLVHNAPGATAAVLVDWEGEMVALYNPGEHTDWDIKFMGAHHGILLDRARRMIERNQLGGEATSLAFSHQRFNVLTMPVNHDYCVVLTLRRGAMPALAASAMKRALAQIEADIA